MVESLFHKQEYNGSSPFSDTTLMRSSEVGIAPVQDTGDPGFEPQLFNQVRNDGKLFDEE